MSTNSEVIANCLKNTPLLKTVNFEEIAKVSEKCKLLHVKKGDVIFRKDEPSNNVYFVYKGQIAEFVSYNASVEVIVKLRNKYDYIGEMGAFSEENYANTAVAIENSSLIEMRAGDFLTLVRNNVSSMEFIIKMLVERLRKSAQKMINTMYINAEGKLAFTIIRLLSRDDTNDNDYVNINQSELAASAGIRRQTAARILGEWRNLGIIKTARGRIYPKDIDALMEILLNSELENC